MSAKRQTRHGPVDIVRKLQDADAMRSAGKCLAAVLRGLEVSEAAYHRWRNRHRCFGVGSGGRTSEEANRLMLLEDENRRLTLNEGD